MSEQADQLAVITTADGPAAEESRLADCYAAVRRLTEELTESLQPEDMVVQSMTDASPAKWHLAHTSWFFETFLLRKHLPGYDLFHPQFEVLFNSYYNAVGSQHPRPQRGLLTRPTVTEVMQYRRHVDFAMEELFDHSPAEEIESLIAVGINHEQQHQELLLTDILHACYCNPMWPAVRDDGSSGSKGCEAASPLTWQGIEGGRRRVGFAGAGFCFDNELPQHDVVLRPFDLACRPVTCGEYLQFIEDRGYRRPELWLSDGWDAARTGDWQAPLYWQRDGDRWQQFTLFGLRSMDEAAPVCHVSYYEADAYARWAGARLPTEAEWEVASSSRETAELRARGNLLESGRWHPRPAGDRIDALQQLLGDVWEWTSSPYIGYPGYRADPGALGEYNGKFMCNQMVLRGGSCVTPASHIRTTYRNFFGPDKRWQFSGIRLAVDA